jgi:hypothetical protein
MKLGSLLVINSVVAVASGIAFIVAPAHVLAMYGVRLTPMGLVVYQFWGTTLLGLGLLTWWARNVGDRGVRRELALTRQLTRSTERTVRE